MHAFGSNVVPTTIVSSWCNQSMTKTLEKNKSYCENIWQWAQAHREMKEGDVARLCDTKCKTYTTMKDNNDALKRKGLLSWW